MKVHIKNFGCQMNKLDSALVTASFKDANFEITDSIKDADAVLINTCSVREHAEQRVFSHLGHLKHLKETKPDVVVAVFGCMAQRLGAELLNHPAVNIVCSPANIPHLLDFVTDALNTKKQTLAITENIRTTDPQNPALEKFESLYDTDDKAIPAQAFVRVMRGCNNFCSYCIVPYVRGPEVSRPPQAIIDQAKRLADQGTKQITLLGQTVNSYSYTAGDKTYNLADILQMTSDIEGIERIRFVTNYPFEKNFAEICKAIRDLPKVCQHLHMPAQSGSNTILKAMNRKYTVEQYLDLLETARSYVPDIAIASDFIVGFPGETDEDFQLTIDLVNKAKFKNSFVFKYSPRPGTVGEKRMPDDISLEIKKQRNIALLAAQEKISAELAQNMIGKKVQVLVEGQSKKSNPETGTYQMTSRTPQDWIVVFDTPKIIAGQLVDVTIQKASPLTLFGKL